MFTNRQTGGWPSIGIWRRSSTSRRRWSGPATDRVAACPRHPPPGWRRWSGALAAPTVGMCPGWVDLVSTAPLTSGVLHIPLRLVVAGATSIVFFEQRCHSVRGSRRTSAPPPARVQHRDLQIPTQWSLSLVDPGAPGHARRSSRCRRRGNLFLRAIDGAQASDDCRHRVGVVAHPPRCCPPGCRFVSMMPSVWMMPTLSITRSSPTAGSEHRCGSVRPYRLRDGGTGGRGVTHQDNAPAARTVLPTIIAAAHRSFSPGRAFESGMSRYQSSIRIHRISLNASAGGDPFGGRTWPTAASTSTIEFGNAHRR